METLAATASLPLNRKTANYDEISMQQTILFADTLKDLKNLKTQLYSAAQFFELSYINNDQKDIWCSKCHVQRFKLTWPAYWILHMVGHLGSVTYKVNDLLEEKFEQISVVEQRVSCMDQWLRTCREVIIIEGVAQQRSIIDASRYHKRYTLPGGEGV